MQTQKPAGAPVDQPPNGRGTVLHVGGAHTLGLIAREQLINLRDAGWDVHVACSDDAEWTDALRAQGLPVWTLPLPHRASSVDVLASARPLARIVRERKVQIVHTNNAHHGVIGRLVARSLRVASVHTWRYNPVDASSNSAGRAVFGAIEGVASRAGQRVLFQNREDMAFAVDSRIVPAAKATWIGNGVKLHEYSRGARDTDAVRQSMGVAPRAEMITCVARLTERKGQIHLVRALPRLLAERPDAQVVLVGTGPTEEEWRREEAVLREEATRLGCMDRLHFAGHRDDVAAVLAASDVVCLPSRREGVPRVLMEAMAAGVPVVATDVVGTRELVRDGQTGILVPFGDPAGLADGLIRMLSQPDLKDRCTAAAARCVAEEWSADMVTRRIDAVYRELSRLQG